MNNILKISELRTGYDNAHPVIKSPFSATAEPGQITGIIGPNGSGKTTLLKTLCCLIKPLSGNVLLGNENITLLSPLERAKRISYIMTGSSVIPDIKVSEVVEMGRFSGTGWIRSHNQTDKILCENATERTGISHLLSKRFHAISDGEKQRVLFAMALAQNTQVMLFDEPAAFLDIPAKHGIYKIMHDISRTDNKTIIFSTHDISNAIAICDKLWAFSENKIESGLPEYLGIKNVFSMLFPDNILLFDTEKMDYVTTSISNSIPVDIKGDGTKYKWTVSLLKRLGFDPGCNISAVLSVITNENDDKWIINYNSNQVIVSSLAEFEEKMKCVINKQPL